MPLDDLYELIRRGEVLLWVGSGFSFYAGFPSVNEIKNLLYNSTSKVKQQQLDLSRDLIHFSEDFVVLNGRPALERLIQERFKKPPLAEHLHQELGLVSHFKRIITTNYDELLETNFPPRTAKITGNRDIISTSHARVKIYKIHGDISDGKSLVITAADYSTMYNRNFKDPFWAAVIHEIASHHILFLGYGYEDENIWADFDYIDSKLKSTIKKRYLISPSLTSIKKKKLKKLGIEYIQLNGEQFLAGLISNIKENLVADFNHGLIDSQTAQDFATGFDMRIKFEATKNTSAIVSLQKATGDTRHTIKFTSSDEAFVENYVQFSNSYAVPALRLTADKLKEFAFFIEDFKFMDMANLAEIDIIHEAQKGEAEISFPEDRLTISKLAYEVFSGIPRKSLIKINYYGILVEFDLEVMPDRGIKIDFKLEEPDNMPSKSRCVKFYRAVYNLLSGKKMQIIVPGQPVQNQQFAPHNEAAQLKTFMNRYQMLIDIEKKYKVKLPSISIRRFTSEDKKSFNKLSALLRNGYQAIRDEGGLTIVDAKFYSKLSDNLKEMKVGTYLSIESKEPASVKLLGKEIVLGHEQTAMLRPKIISSDKSKFSITLLPEDQILLFYYDKTGFLNLKGQRTIL
jgi:hypothetical protein